MDRGRSAVFSGVPWEKGKKPQTAKINPTTTTMLLIQKTISTSSLAEAAASWF